MEAEIETCYGESGPNQSEEINFDLISRYYQILLNQAENSSGKIERKLIMRFGINLGNKNVLKLQRSLRWITSCARWCGRSFSSHYRRWCRHSHRWKVRKCDRLLLVRFICAQICGSDLMDFLSVRTRSSRSGSSSQPQQVNDNLESSKDNRVQLKPHAKPPNLQPSILVQQHNQWKALKARFRRRFESHLSRECKSSSLWPSGEKFCKRRINWVSHNKL